MKPHPPGGSGRNSHFPLFYLKKDLTRQDLSGILALEVVTMSTVQYSTKLTPEQVKALKKISQETHIPQAVLVRQAVSMLIEEFSKKAVSLNFLNLAKKEV